MGMSAPKAPFYLIPLISLIPLILYSQFLSCAKWIIGGVIRLRFFDNTMS